MYMISIPLEYIGWICIKIGWAYSFIDSVHLMFSKRIPIYGKIIKITFSSSSSSDINNHDHSKYWWVRWVCKKCWKVVKTFPFIFFSWKSPPYHNSEQHQSIMKLKKKFENFE